MTIPGTESQGLSGVVPASYLLTAARMPHLLFALAQTSNDSTGIRYNHRA